MNQQELRAANEIHGNNISLCQTLLKAFAVPNVSTLLSLTFL